MIKNPTPYPEVNRLLEELFESVRTVLGSHLVGMYLDGSLTGADFDQDSDIDFVVVTDEEITHARFLALQAMHDRLAALDTPWAIQLEGSYISQQAVRRYDPAHTLYPNIERGEGERLKLVHHKEAWDVHRSVLRERGITLAGPPPDTLIDSVLPGHLQQAMLYTLSEWAAKILNEPSQMSFRGYQSYTVLSLCRILYTLQTGTVVSKPFAARWAQETLGERWSPLIERALWGRHNSGTETSPEEVHETLEFIRFAQERSRDFQTPAAA